MPLISVILPVYNGGEYLKKSVQSVLSQGQVDFEFIVLDDCSSDGSYEYLCEIKDQRLRLFRNEANRGLFFSLNRMVSLCSAQLIKLWSQDDIMFPDCLASIVDFHYKHPDIGFSYTQYETIDAEGEVISRQNADITPEIIPPDLHSRIALYSGSIAGNIANVTITRKAFDRVGLFIEDMKISGDFEMWVRIAQFFPVGYLKKKLIYLRAHAGQLSRQEDLFIYHLKEDSEVYGKLFSYLDMNSKPSARRLMRWSKSQFYYKLMLKCLLHGKLSLFKRYYQYISSMDSVLLLSVAFLVKNVGARKINLNEVMSWPNISHVE